MPSDMDSELPGIGSRNSGSQTRRKASRRQLIGDVGAGLLATLLSGCQNKVQSAVKVLGATVTPLTSVTNPAPTAPNGVATATTSSISPAHPAPTSPTANPSPTDFLHAPSPTVRPASSPVPSATSLPTRIVVNPNGERLQPNGPPHDPGPLTWAHPGPYLGSVASEVASFSSKQPLVTTYYFYWFDLTDPSRREPDWKIHPPDPDHYSFLNPATHLRQFEDMQAAGIDFALPVYWSEPGHPGRSFNLLPGHDFSTEGIPPMVAALDALASAGHPLKLGMFYDTTILANADLTTANGKAYFYVNVRDFYSKIPPRHWAAIDNKPIVWLYDTQWVSRFDQASFDDLSTRFADDFGGLRPYLVREWEWYRSKGVTPSTILQSDNLYGWGAAPSGFNSDPRFGVSEVGPGFNNTGYCHGGPAQNCFDVKRENGAYYERQLAAALQTNRKIIAIETWNEFDEGSAVAETIEYGRTDINITRRYADAYHAGRRTIR